MAARNSTAPPSSQPQTAPAQTFQSTDPRWQFAWAILGWVGRQNPVVAVNCVLLAFICGGGLYSAHWLVETGVPAHLQQIDSGYQRLADKFIEDNQRRDRENREHVDKLGEKWESVVGRLEAVASQQSLLIRDLISQRRNEKSSSTE